MTAADPGLDERPASAEVLARLYDGVRANASDARAAAFVADVRADGSDAVRVELEHQEGVASMVLLPYTRSRFKRTVNFGIMSASGGERRIWASE